MQSLRNHISRTQTSAGRQLGSTNWAFIIALLVALVFIWLWFQETDKQEKHASDIALLKQQNGEINAEGAMLADKLVELSNVVGYKGPNITLSKITRNNTSFTISDAAQIKLNFDPEGVVAGAEEGSTQDGVLKKIIAAAQLTFEREARLHTTTTGKETEHKFTTLSTAFKEKQAAVQAQWEDMKFSKPIAPADPDDEQGKARYLTELQEWEDKVKRYHEALAELSGMAGWKEYTARIAAPGTWGDITKAGVTVQFYQYQESGTRTIEAAMAGLDTAFERIGGELRANMQTWGQEVSQLRKDTAAKEASITDLNGQLQAEQEAHTNDVSQLQDRITQETERANRNAIKATNAENEKAKAVEDAGKTVASLNRDLEARREQNRLLKEKQDLKIARDDVDGTVLMANSTLGTAMIDLGHKDKAYVGQKFVVSALDRAGNRVNKGELMVVRVTGDHVAKCRILSGSAGRADRIHNPFYAPGDRIYVYFAAKLDKWPKDMATERLAKMNVVVQSAPNGDTTYIIVPNSWAAPVETSGDDDEDEGDDEGTSATTPLEQAQKTARLFGANVITERLLDAFLDY